MLNQKRDERSIDDLAVDDVVMSAAALALASPAEKRDAYIHGACGGDAELIRQVRDYLEWEERMDGFLEESLFSPDEPPFQRGDLADGRFDILRDAGEGGMGWVYEGWDRQLNCRVAIKCSKAGFHKRLPPEVLHAREIAHRNVCKVFDIHTAQTRRGEIEFISMEFLEGETLATRLEKVRLVRASLSKKEALGLARQICAGLAEAHRKGVVHGDVKSNNIINARDADGHVRAVVTDFGLARTPGATGIRGTAQSMAGGAMDYVAPEVWNGGKATRASDVYGLGVILCELFAGRRPFGPDARIEQRFQGKPPAMGTKWDRLLARCLEPDPARRFQSAAEVAEAIDPPAWPRYAAAAAAAVLLAAVGSVEMNRYLSKEPVRLALDPVEASSAELMPLAAKLTHDVAAQLNKIKGGDKFRLSFIPPEKARTADNATNVLHVTLIREDGKVLVHAQLTDARSKSRVEDWTPAYAPGEERYVPVALAGMVTGALKLPPLQIRQVNAAAHDDYWRGRWYVRRNSGIDIALTLLERAVEGDPNSPLAHAALAEAQWQKYFALTKDRKWLERTAESVREAQIRDPDMAEVRRIAGLLEYDAGRYELAEGEFLRAAALDPKDSDAHRRLGMTYEARNTPGDVDKALAEYRHAIELEPGYHANHQQLGAFLRARSEYQEAVIHYRQAVGLAPAEPSTHRDLANAYEDNGQFSEAENELRAALSLRETATVRLSLAVLLMYQRRDLEGIPYMVRAGQMQPDSYLSWIDLGIAYRRAGLLSEAARANRRGLEIAQTAVDANPRRGYPRAFLAFACAWARDKRCSETEVTQALQLSPHDGDVRFMVAATYEALNERSNALNVLSGSPDAVIADVNRWPDTADTLRQDTRFLQLLESRGIR